MWGTARRGLDAERENGETAEVVTGETGGRESCNDWISAATGCGWEEKRKRDRPRKSGDARPKPLTQLALALAICLPSSIFHFEADVQTQF